MTGLKDRLSYAEAEVCRIMMNAIAYQIRTGCRTALALIGVGLLAGCAGNLMPYTANVRNLMPEEAVVMPPPGGPAIISVLETQYSNAIDQRILLRTDARTPGQNYINAVFFGTRNYSPMNGRTLDYRSVTDLRVDEEMREELPGVQMVQSPYYVQNNYGPFGYAFGYGRGDDLCIYGWQQIRPGRDTRAAFGQAGTIQIRLRFCESGASEDDLLGIMYGYTVNAAVEAYGWNPYGEQASPPPLLGETGAPIYPRRAYDDRSERVADTEKVLPGSTARSTTTRTRTTTTATRATTPVATGDEISVDVVRLPPGSLPSGGYVNVPPAPGLSPSSVTARPGALPATGSSLPTPGRQTPAASATPATTTPAAGAASTAAPASARSIPVPARPAASATSSAPAAATTRVPTTTTRSVPSPPCRLLPGSTTVSCE
ncbi:cellulose biosynthesis protein BcsN [Martelella lutilitoris]|uniref:Cellulose biosynthesis protein BcsN n=1 Tax=Martelella lutilitoris TaxID=2583532 RepID=A0A5C4JVF2_9HYPH|nr:cellulose biosynthesis protein BcsN [Martelella lutilitoris]TNB49207.1 cellulose biosynthesis protein BcsN [Martelella lutilitoris]